MASIDLTPNFKQLRQTFGRDADRRALNILANLVDETLIAPENVTRVKLGVLREFQSILNSLDMVTQCTTTLKELKELRELVHSVSQKIITTANNLEASFQYDTDLCDTCGRSGMEISHEGDNGKTVCVECAAVDERDEPDQDDWVTNDHIYFTQHGHPRATDKRVVVKEGEDWRTVLKARMDADQYWPDVWFISDHGNAHALDMNDGQHMEAER